MERNPVLIILAILAGLNMLAWVAVYDLSKGAKLLEVTFFDVGQGDAALTVWMQYVPSYSGLNSLTAKNQTVPV